MIAVQSNKNIFLNLCNKVLQIHKQCKTSISSLRCCFPCWKFGSNLKPSKFNGFFQSHIPSFEAASELYKESITLLIYFVDLIFYSAHTPKMPLRKFNSHFNETRFIGPLYKQKRNGTCGIHLSLED